MFNKTSLYLKNSRKICSFRSFSNIEQYDLAIIGGGPGGKYITNNLLTILKVM